jgi:hypothetical protein
MGTVNHLAPNWVMCWFSEKLFDIFQWRVVSGVQAVKPQAGE